MNGPVHEVPPLPRQLDLRLARSLPLEPPDEHEPPTSQALHLSATPGTGAGRAAAPADLQPCGAGEPHAPAPWPHSLPACPPASLPPADLLLGRADSGMCWVFDLSECMGWADGSHPGTWLAPLPQPASAHAGGGGGDAAQGDAEEWEASEGLAGSPDAPEVRAPGQRRRT